MSIMNMEHGKLRLSCQNGLIFVLPFLVTTSLYFDTRICYWSGTAKENSVNSNNFLSEMF